MRRFLHVLAGAAFLFVVESSAVFAQRASVPNQGAQDPRIPPRPSSTPPGNDTVGYWQQHVDYRIVATLDEQANALHATGTLRYTNNSPDVLHELWIHQHLNAFRPGSRWSAVDEREGRIRFQRLQDPDYAYERFTSPPRVNGVAVTPEYPLSPDSTVVRLALAQELRPGQTISVEFAWDARPATLPRRQGRRDRSYDFAQWYPKVAVYDRLGWRPNALVPAGEFYGEYGNYDVALAVRDDQVIGATGIPIEGDPGWGRVNSTAGGAAPTLMADAYGSASPSAGSMTTGAARGLRAVRFIAQNVHHFAWSASPGFRYEEALYSRTDNRDVTRSAAGMRTASGAFPLWPNVPVRVLYRGDAAADCAIANGGIKSDAARFDRAVSDCVNSSLTQWQGGKAAAFGVTALGWLESVYGPYPYPQMTIVKRLDGGGTEFPMMQQNGSASLGLTLHEGGHIFTYGVLGNNEWQSGWMDEGLTSYQTAWQSGGVRVAIANRFLAANERDPSASSDASLAAARTRLDTNAVRLDRSVLQGISQPIGIRADLFSDFGVYNDAVYNRAQYMYQSLHDVLGDKDFRAFMRDYFARWTFKHVDRWAMQGSAERVSKQQLGWFFDQWVNDVGVIDYRMRNPTVTKSARGYVVRVQLERVGNYRHPMPVGVRTASGWTTVRADPARDSQWVEVTVTQKPDAVWLDPFGFTDSQSARYYRLALSAQ